MGYIYILTNPSFPDYIKIGYADDDNERLKELNRSECIPYAFRVYATYQVDGRLKDINVHNMLDTANSELRTIDEFDGKKRVREFYAMSPEDAYSIFKNMAIIHGTEDRLVLHKKEAHELKDEKLAKEIKELSKNRHHFKDIEFRSSLTNRWYKGTTGDDGTLCIIDKETDTEIPNNSKPSKKAIIGQAIIDLGGSTTNEDTLYQRYHMLTKLVEKV